MGWSRSYMNTINHYCSVEPVLKRKAVSRNKTRKASNLSRENSRPPLNSCKSGALKQHRFFKPNDDLKTIQTSNQKNLNQTHQQNLFLEHSGISLTGESNLTLKPYPQQTKVHPLAQAAGASLHTSEVDFSKIIHQSDVSQSDNNQYNSLFLSPTNQEVNIQKSMILEMQK